MPVSVQVEIGGDRRFEGVLSSVTSPRVLARAMTRGAAELHRQMRIHVSGPRPRRLDAVTGELRESFEPDLSGLPFVARVGTPIPLWPALHEEGTGKRRRRAFAKPALDAAVSLMPGFFADEMDRAAARLEPRQLAATITQPGVITLDPSQFTRLDPRALLLPVGVR